MVRLVARGGVARAQDCYAAVMRTLRILPLLLLACTPRGVVLDSPPPSDSEPAVDSDGPEDTAGSETIPDNPADPDRTAWIFSDEQVHRVEIELSAEALAALDLAPKTYVEGSVTFAGQRFERVGVRLKGKVGSFRDLDAKSAFKIDLNRYEAGQDLDGLEKLTLNNMVVDCSMAKERMAFGVFRALGVPAPRTGYAFVSVNGVDYGLYSHIESVDDTFLKRHYEDPGGNLYEAEYLFTGSTFYMPDFAQGYDDLFDLEEGTEVGNADVKAITAALDAYGGTPDFYSALGELVDWEHHHQTMIAELWAGQNDGYSLNENNFYAYFDPTDGRAEIISWDMDYSFLRPSDWGFSWRAVDGRLSNLCIADSTCFAAYLERLEAACDTLDALPLEDELEAVYQLTRPWIAMDTRRECDDSYVTYYRDYLRGWVAGGSASARATWGL